MDLQVQSNVFLFFLGGFEEPCETVCGGNDQRCQDRGGADRGEFQGTMQLFNVRISITKMCFIILISVNVIS